jgi:hypothetical protein
VICSRSSTRHTWFCVSFWFTHHLIRHCIRHCMRASACVSSTCCITMYNTALYVRDCIGYKPAWGVHAEDSGQMKHMWAKLADKRTGVPAMLHHTIVREARLYFFGGWRRCNLGLCNACSSRLGRIYLRACSPDSQQTNGCSMLIAR